MEKALFVTRSQPLWKNHLDAMQQAINNWAREIIVCIGSSNKESTFENPYTIQQRLEFTEKAMQEFQLAMSRKWVYFDYQIWYIPDKQDSYLWAKQLKENFDFDTVISGNQWVINYLPNKKIMVPTENVMIRSTHTRKKIAKLGEMIQKTSKQDSDLEFWTKKEIVESEVYQELKEKIPKSVLKYLIINDLATKLTDICNQEWIEFNNKPEIAVDGVVFDHNWNIVLIKRKNPPYGYALPWWMMDYNETLGEALRRELKEELGLDVDIIWNEENPFLVRSSPWRDPRHHIVSVVYKTNIISWTFEAWSDAADIIVMDPEEVLEKIDLAFDHQDIIRKVIWE